MFHFPPFIWYKRASAFQTINYFPGPIQTIISPWLIREGLSGNFASTIYTLFHSKIYNLKRLNCWISTYLDRTLLRNVILCYEVFPEIHFYTLLFCAHMGKDGVVARWGVVFTLGDGCTVYTNHIRTIPKHGQLYRLFLASHHNSSAVKHGKSPQQRGRWSIIV